MIKLRKHDGYCDFCGEHAGEFACSDHEKAEDRDVCGNCVREMSLLFGTAKEKGATVFGKVTF